jgi:hypothetical protein
MKKYGFSYKRAEFERMSKPWSTQDERLVRCFFLGRKSDPINVTAKLGLYHNVWTFQDVFTCINLSIPSYSFTFTGRLYIFIQLAKQRPSDQNNTTFALYPDVRTCIRRTWKEERLRGFYRGLGTNLVRVLPGNCVTFVVYENLVWLLRTQAIRRKESSR